MNASGIDTIIYLLTSSTSTCARMNLRTYQICINGLPFGWKRIKEEKILTKTKEDYEKFNKDFEGFGKGEVIIGNIYENPELLEVKV